MTERERLSRIFGFEPLEPRGALVAAGALCAIPGMWIVSVTVGVALTAIYAAEQRRLRDGLGEVDGHGFPVVGYRAWLLAFEPAFDLELRRDIALELLEGALGAVDPTIAIERRAERVVRVVMRPVEVRIGERARSFLAGDRRRLAEVIERVLAPLHADVGITMMRMGNRASLAALVATPTVASMSGDAFREQGKAAPIELQSLVHVGTSQLRPPLEARALGGRLDRLLFATRQRPTNAGVMALVFGGCGAVVGAAFGPLGFAVGAAVGSGVAYSMRRSDRANLRRALQQASLWPFPIEGYEDWLLSGRPILDIEFDSSPARDDLERRLRVIVRVAELTWLSDHVVRVETEPTLHLADTGILPFWGGDPRELQQLGRVVLVPMHDAHRIVAVRMGGYLDRRV